MLVCCFLQILPAVAGKRIALVVANSGYAHVTNLDNPTNDAQDVAAALQELGFEVIIGIDLDKHSFDDTEFSRAIADADVALFSMRVMASQA